MYFIFHLGENSTIFEIVNMLGKIFIIQFQFIFTSQMTPDVSRHFGDCL